MKDTQGFIDAFNNANWAEVANAISKDDDFSLSAEVKYTSTILGWWTTDKKTTYRELFVQAKDVPKDIMEDVLEKDKSTVEELVDDMIAAKSIGVKQAIAEDLSKNAPEDVSAYKEKVVEWLSEISELEFPAEDYNEIVENLVKAKIITIQDAINVYWSNYDSINELLSIDKTAVAESKINIRKKVSVGIGNMEWEVEEISMVQLFVLEDEITANSLKALLTRSVSPDVIVAAMIKCEDAEKMKVMAEKLVNIGYKVEDEKLSKKLKAPVFEESQALLFQSGKLTANAGNVGVINQLFGKTTSDLDGYIAKNNINVIAGYINNSKLTDSENKLINKYISGLVKDDLAAFYNAIKDEKKLEVIKANFTALSLYKNGNIDILKTHLTEIDLTAVDKDGNNVLHYAIMRKDYEFAQYLIQNLGASVMHHENNNGITPLMLFAVIKHEDVKVLKKLVEEIVSKGDFELEVFIRICAVKNTDLMDLVIKTKYPDIEQRKLFLQSLFQKSFFQNEIDLIRKLIEKYSPNELDLNNGDSTFKPLEYAYVNKAKDLFNVLVFKDKNINADVVLSNNKTIFHDALISRNADVINALVDSKCKFELNNAHNPDHNPPLVDAMLKLYGDVVNGNVKITDAEIDAFVKLLDVEGLDINVVDKTSNSTPIMFIYQAILECKNNTQKEQLEKLFTVLINHKDFDALSINKDGMNLLNLVSERGDKERLKTLLKQQNFVKDNIAVAKKDGFIPMLTMIAMGDTKIFAEIKGVLLNTNESLENEHLAIAFLQQDANKLDALMASAISGNKEIFDDIRRIIGDKKIDFKRRDALGNTVFHHAVGNPEILESLINVVNIDVRNKDGLTALSIAVCKGNIASLKILIENGADFNLPDNNGITPLMYAVLNGNEEVMNLLLAQRGIDINAKNKKGLTAFMLAALTDERLKTEGLNVAKMQELNASGGDWVGNNGIMKKLILRGAEPTFGYAYDSIGGNLVYSLVSSSAAMRSLNYMGTYLAAAGRVAPVAGMVTMAETGYFNSIFSGLAAWQVSKQVSASVYTKAMSWMEFGPRIDFTSDRIMIGVFTYGWFGSVVSGNALKDSLKNHEIYKHSQFDSIVFVGDKDALHSRSNKSLQDHDDLVARYFAVNKELSKYQWPWARRSLNLLKNEILEADKVILGNILNKISPKEESDILDLITGKNRDQVIYQILTNKKHGYESLQNIIKAINGNEVVASIALIDAVVEFNKRTKEMKEEVAKPSLFSKIFKPYTGSTISSDVLKDERLSNLKNGMINLDKVQPKELELASAKPIGRLHQCVEFIAGISGKDSKDVARSVAGVASSIGGALGGFTALSMLNPTFGATYGRAVVGAVATGVTIQATSLFGVLVAAASSVVTIPVVVPAVVVGAAFYTLSGKKEGASVITNEELKSTSSSDIVDFIEKNSVIEEPIVTRERSLSTSSNASTAANVSEVDRSPKITSAVDLKVPDEVPDVEKTSLERNK